MSSGPTPICAPGRLDSSHTSQPYHASLTRSVAVMLGYVTDSAYAENDLHLAAGGHPDGSLTVAWATFFSDDRPASPA
jgi:hypothetical protein